MKHALNVKSKQPTNWKEIILLCLRGATESSGGGLLKQIANDCWLKLRQIRQKLICQSFINNLICLNSDQWGREREQKIRV